jgi:hypothetical protein
MERDQNGAIWLNHWMNRRRPSDAKILRAVAHAPCIFSASYFGVSGTPNWNRGEG